MERRRFLGVVGAGGAFLGIAGCASAVTVPVVRSNGSVRLELDDYAALSREGGFLRLRVEEDDRLLYLLALEGGEIAALSPVCTHQGCIVDVVGRYLICPCHGSTYSREGEVVRGPAPLPLSRFPTRIAAGRVLVIELAEG